MEKGGGGPVSERKEEMQKSGRGIPTQRFADLAPISHVYFAGGDVFKLNISVCGKNRMGLLDTGATCSIASEKALPIGCQLHEGAPCTVKMGNGQVEPLNKLVLAFVIVKTKTLSHKFYVLKTEAFDFVVGTDFFVAHPECAKIVVPKPFKWEWKQ